MQVSPQGTVAVAVAKRALALLLCDFLTLLFAIGVVLWAVWRCSDEAKALRPWAAGEYVQRGEQTWSCPVLSPCQSLGSVLTPALGLGVK